MQINVTLNLKGMPDWTLDQLIQEANAERALRNPPKLVIPPLNADELRMIRFDMMIAAIKSYRERTVTSTGKFGLRETKDLCDVARAGFERDGTFVPRER